MAPKVPEWLNNAVIYNVYPQSFYDSNGDGIGDLRGVIEKLDYIESLGVNCIWLNPIYISPFGDAGYDVSDFRRVDPRYGSNKDAEELFMRAAERGIYVLLDLVAGHTSIHHPWFQASSSPEPNKYTNWYVWTDQTFAPTGGGNYISGYSARDGKYMANFFYFQPALNYGWADPQEDWQLPTDHPDVKAMKAEMRDIMRYWLDSGASGFRVDMAHSLVKGDPDNTATMDYWQEVRQWLDTNYPNAALVSEWSVPNQALRCGFHADFMIHSGTKVYTTLFRNERGRNVSPTTDGYSFFDRAGQGNVRKFLDVYQKHLAETKDNGFISVPTGNHDLPRLNKGRKPEELKIAFAFIFTLPGVPTLYYGDEIGMRHIDGLISKEGGYVRTGARTPMQWDDSRNAGFSDAAAAELYLPVDTEENRPVVTTQEKDRESLLNLTRRLIKLRKEYLALASDGEFIPLYAVAGEYPLVYLRWNNNQDTVVVALNPAERDEQCTIDLPEFISNDSWKPLEMLGDVKISSSSSHQTCEISMPPLSFAIWQSGTKIRK